MGTLADAQNDALGWMERLDRPEVAWRWSARGGSEYRVRVARRDVEPLRLKSTKQGWVLVILNRRYCPVLNCAPLGSAKAQADDGNSLLTDHRLAARGPGNAIAASRVIGV
jgi:hypothetical protein